MSFAPRRMLAIAAITLAIPTHAWAAAPSRNYDGVRGSEWKDPEADVPESTTPPTTKRHVPPPRVDRRAKDRIAVAVGLSPEAPGSKDELALLERLERTATSSPDPLTTVRRLRPGAGDAQSICRDRRDDLVVFIGYVPRRNEPVVLAHDCRLDAPLGIRATAAVDEPGFVGALWAEHDELVRQGAKERRRLGKLSVKARAGIAASIAIVVVGVAVGLLVANALRDERVVLKVAP